MKIGKILGGIVKIGGPVVVGFAAGGPLGAVAGLSAQLAGGGEKKRGKKAEAAGGLPVHKLTAPTAAVATATLLGGLLDLAGVSNPGAIEGALCGSGAQVGALIGALSVVLHQFGIGIERARVRRS